MDAPDCERVSERPESRGKLKLRGGPAVRGLAADESHGSGNRRAGRTDQCVSVLPKCPPTGGCAKCRDKEQGPPFFRADQKEPGAGEDTKLFLPSGLSFPDCMAGYLWPSTPRRPLEPRIFPCRFTPASGDPRPAFLAHAPAAPKFVAPAGAQRCACPSPTSGGLRLCFVFPAITE
jgi:hypothetical protein